MSSNNIYLIIKIARSLTLLKAGVVHCIDKGYGIIKCKLGNCKNESGNIKQQ